MVTQTMGDAPCSQIKPVDRLASLRLYGLAVLLSLSISIWQNTRYDVIVPDGISYLFGALLIQQKGLFFVLHHQLYGITPFYSFLIAKIVYFTHLPYLFVAFSLNALFSALSVGLFVGIIHAAGGTLRTAWFGVLIMMFFYMFNSTRSYIIRDHGYWACYLCSFYALLRYAIHPLWRWAVLWNVALSAATLLRVEGILFYFFLPWLTLGLVDSWPARLIHLVKLYLPTIGVVVCAIWFVYGMGYHAPLHMLHLFLTQHVAGHVHGLLAVMPLLHRYYVLQVALQRVFVPFGIHDLWFIAPWLLIGWYIFRVISNLSFGYCLLVLYALRDRLNGMRHAAKQVWFAYVAINVGITFTF